MSTPPLPELRRRRDLLLLAGAVAFLPLAASPLAALAQTAPREAPPKIGTIGAGREGGALGTLFVKVGHPVMFSSRHPEELKDLVAAAAPRYAGCRRRSRDGGGEARRRWPPAASRECS
jgi:hypothetical protein